MLIPLHSHRTTIVYTSYSMPASADFDMLEYHHQEERLYAFVDNAGVDLDLGAVESPNNHVPQNGFLYHRQVSHTAYKLVCSCYAERAVRVHGPSHEQPLVWGRRKVAWPCYIE